MNDEKNVTANIGFSEALTLLFIALKLCGVISWSWVWGIIPIWITFLLIILIILAVFVMDQKGKRQ